MHIVEKVKLDTTGRLLLTRVFDKMPKLVVVSFETRTKKLFFREVAEGEQSKTARKVDDKNRVCIPKWAREELGEEYYVCVESIDEHYILPSKFLFTE